MALVVLFGSAVGGQLSAQESADLSRVLDACEAEVLADPSYDTYRCFYSTGRRQHGGLDAAYERLVAHRSRADAVYWPELVLGMVATVRRDTALEKVRWFEAAAQGFASIPPGASREPVGELVARTNLYRIFLSLDEADRVAEQVARARDALEGSETSPSYEEAVVRVAVLEARYAGVRGVNLGRSHRDLERAADWVFPNGPEGLQRMVLAELGSLSVTLGRTDEAIISFERLRELQQRRGAVSSELRVRLDILNARLLAAERRPATAERATLERIAADIAEDAMHAGAGFVEARARALHASLTEVGQEALAGSLFERCLEIAAGEALPWLEVECRVQTARRFAGTDPERARAALEGAFRAIQASPNLIYETYVWQAVLSTAALLNEDVLSVGARALDEIERMREVQREEGTRIEVLANWVHDYRLLIGAVLKEDGNEAVALKVAERMRARSLLETLLLSDVDGEGKSFRSGSADVRVGRTDAREMERLDTEIEMVQRQIVRLRAERDSVNSHPGDGAGSVGGSEAVDRDGNGGVGGGKGRRSAELFEELEKLERERQALVAGDRIEVGESSRTEGASQSSGKASLSILAGRLQSDRSGSAELTEVQAHLADDEMLVSFSIGLDRDLYGQPGGGGWAVGVTADRVLSWPVSGRERLETVVPVYVAAIESEASERTTSAAIHRLLFEGLERQDVSSVFPAGLRKLVVVPDGVLHELPFGALRAEPEGQPLAVRFELSVAPSVSLWLRWRSAGRRDGSSVPPGSLVLADPVAAGGVLGSPSDPGGGVLLEPLRFAREEGREACRFLGAECRLLTGNQASEDSLREADLSEVGLVHFASHAFVDATYPERSAVVLAPGSGSDDGLLQPREIAALDLSRRAVVLSACQTAGGRIAGGEGILSLARAFFAAGAHAVLASRWKIGDREAQQLVGWFHESLAAGSTMAEALRTARVQAIEGDMSPSAWASFVVLGDGELRIGARKPQRSDRWKVLLGVGVGLMLSIAFALLASRFGYSSSSSS